MTDLPDPGLRDHGLRDHGLHDPGPLLVFGPRSLSYDLGAGHPLTPARFGPGIELLEAVGATPGLAPEPASDEDLRLAHTAEYIRTVRRFGADPFRPPEAGIGPGDTPAFEGMHEASASVAGGSLRAIEAILRGDVAHAHHPGGGLHHAMPGRASGFCVYDDVGLAVALARRAGARVLYVDLDVHHGDGVQAMHWHDPGVLTISVHQSGRTIFPGTGSIAELGGAGAEGTAVNVPLEPWTGDGPWLDAIARVVPALAAAFGPDLLVTQHGADAHAFDPLGSLLVTTTAMSVAAGCLDRIAHRHAEGRWLATGGGGYDIYRAVPRAWAVTWLAGAHRDAPADTPAGWRERWAAAARHFGQSPMPETFLDPANAGLPRTGRQDLAEGRSSEVVDLVRSIVVAALLREAEDRGWWHADAGEDAPANVRTTAPAAFQAGTSPAGTQAAGATTGVEPAILPTVDAATWERLGLVPRVLAPVDPTTAHGLVLAGLRDPRPARVSAAVIGSSVVAAAISVPDDGDRERLVAIGVAPGLRRRGLATALLRAHLAAGGPAIDWLVTVAERDPVDPLPGGVRRSVAERLLRATGARAADVPRPIREVDPTAVRGRWSR